jgi:hypothetical protein
MVETGGWQFKASWEKDSAGPYVKNKLKAKGHGVWLQ